MVRCKKCADTESICSVIKLFYLWQQRILTNFFACDTMSVLQERGNGVMEKNHKPQCIRGTGFEIDPLRLVSSLVSENVITTSPVLQLFMRHMNGDSELMQSVYRAKLLNSILMGRVQTIAELFGMEDSVSRVQAFSFHVTDFFQKIVDSVNAEMSPPGGNIITYRQSSDAPSFFIFDERKLSVVLYNLIANSITHGRMEKPRVEIKTSIVGLKLRISVRDWGIGIPSEERKIMYKKYQSICAYDIERPYRIKGFGLALCRKLVREMGGTIYYDQIKSGAKFLITLPMPENGRKSLREAKMAELDPNLLYMYMGEAILKFKFMDLKEE